MLGKQRITTFLLQVGACSHAFPPKVLPALTVECTLSACVQRRTHRTKQHGRPSEQPTRPTARQYTTHTRGGMPQCKHCNRVFTGVEGMKKHLKGSCPVLHGGKHSSSQAVVAPASQDESRACGARDREVTPGTFGPVNPPPDNATAMPPEPPADVPLFEQASFRRLLKQGWRTALVDQTVLIKLRSRCVYCHPHQWEGRH